MKWLVLTCKMLFRNRRRTFLTLVSVALALFVFVTLQTVLGALQIRMDAGLGETRLGVIERVSGPRRQLPQSYWTQLERFDHVKAVTPSEFTVLRAGAGETTIYITAVIDPETYARVFESEVRGVPAEDYEAFVRTKNGALVGKQIMEKYGWKVGDRIQMQSMMHRATLDLMICGVLSAPPGTTSSTVETQLRLNRGYYNELINPAGKVNVYWLRLDGPASVTSVIKAVTDYYEAAQMQVAVETESSMSARFSSYTATIQLVMQIISGIVLFTILIVAANTIALAMRERRKEIAVMKALGYTSRRVLALVLLEAVVTSLVGGLLGTMTAFLLFNLSGATLSIGLTFRFAVTPEVVRTGLVVSVLLGAVSGLVPAYNAARTNVIRTLRSV